MQINFNDMANLHNKQNKKSVYGPINKNAVELNIIIYYKEGVTLLGLGYYKIIKTQNRFFRYT